MALSIHRNAVILLLVLLAYNPQAAIAQDARGAAEVFARENLVAWCIVPFDDRSRSPQARCKMLLRLGFKKYAYDYRAEHLPTFDAEMEAVKKHGIQLVGWWFPTTLSDEARIILDVLRRHEIQTQLWVTGGGTPTTSQEEQRARIKAEAARIEPIARAAAEIGCSVGLYNHGGWFGEPENQIEIIRELKLANVGVVYNLHHGHNHLDRFAQLLDTMKPYLYALNLNGMTRDGDQGGKKILPIGEGEFDLQILRTIAQSGYSGPIGILNHTQENAEKRLQQNLDGLQSLLRQLDTPPQPPPAADDTSGYSADAVGEILARARREGDWTPASMICAVTPGKGRQLISDESRIGGSQPPHFGSRGPQADSPPDLPLVYLPRGLDNSSGGQAFADSHQWGPLQGQLVHFSYGAATHFLVLRDEVQGTPQGAVVPLPGEFHSGAHRGRFRPQDGQLYVAGAGGWGNYRLEDGCFQRVRYTGRDIQLPIGFHVHRNGVHVKFARPLDPETALDPSNHFAQCWNYRYGPGYGSPEFSTRHPGTRGHDTLRIASTHVSPDRHWLFIELPELQPVNQLHLYLQTSADETCELFVTVHAMDVPFENFPGYVASDKTIAPHPILADVVLATRSVPNTWRKPIKEAREVRIACASNLTFDTPAVPVRAGEPIRLTLVNPDVVPHNWALLKPGTLQRVGDLTNRFIADPEAPLRHYVPDSPDVLVYTDVVPSKEEFSVYFRAPDVPGRYPYLCTFPGHWSVMNGELIVEP